jgi:hypothetical protein
MARTMYVHMNKWIKKEKEKREARRCQSKVNNKDTFPEKLVLYLWMIMYLYMVHVF